MGNERLQWLFISVLVVLVAGIYAIILNAFYEDRKMEEKKEFERFLRELNKQRGGTPDA